MFIWQVFGKTIGVSREQARWLVWRVDVNEGKYARLYDVAIPMSWKKMK